MKVMEWQQILGFYYVAKLKSFTRAAEATYRTQSALTQQVKSIEEELECQLFERIGKRKINLTPLGERFFRFSESLLEEYERLIGDIEKDKGLKKGRLKLAAPFTTLYHLLPDVIRKFNRKFPWVELSLFDRLQGEVVELIRGGDVDLGFVLESSLPAELNSFRWKKVEPVLLTPAGHPLAKEKKVSLERIAQYPLILPSKSSDLKHRSRLEELFRQHDLKHTVIMESSNIELSSIYVEMGLGVSFASIVRGLPVFKKRKIELVFLGHYLTTEHICVATRKEKKISSIHEAFMDALASS
jgi:DNA-binding transcriptional LysR family regulator